MLKNAILSPVMLCHQLHMWKDVFPSSLKYLQIFLYLHACEKTM